MYRPKPSISYDILHGIHLSKNLSVILAYLSYFPPPPPMLPGPPPSRSWTCPSSSSSSCSLSSTRHSPSFRQYLSFPSDNQSTYLPSPSSVVVNRTDSTVSSSLLESLLDLFRKPLPVVLLFVVIASISVVVICLIVVCVYLSRQRQRQLSTAEKKKFSYRLIPHRRKGLVTKDNSRNHDRDHQLQPLRKDSPSPKNIRISHASRISTHPNDETEEAV